jgi:hypothetical protein
MNLNPISYYNPIFTLIKILHPPMYRIQQQPSKYLSGFHIITHRGRGPRGFAEINFNDLIH